MTKIQAFLKQDHGATAIEYALIASLIAIAIATVLLTMGGALSDAYKNVVDMF